MIAADLARQRERLARAQDGICPECTLSLPEDLTGTEVDHIIPRARGGPDLAWNRQLVHFRCNRSKRCVLTDAAAALAAEHGITLHEIPKPRRLSYWLSYQPTEISRWAKEWPQAD
jgi:5-methylcytosine-specific restriction endonuclease McrA